jgi:hypothetical protein
MAARSGGAGSSNAFVGPVVVRGNGIGTAKFGQTEAVAIANLKKVFGQPSTSTPVSSGGGGCDTDQALEWSIPITAYFYHHIFVGYSTGYQGWSSNEKIPNVVTAEGLRVGNTVARAERLYPHKVQLSFENGARTYFVTDKSGTIYGYLTAQGSSPVLPTTGITGFWSGSTGCPAVTPWNPPLGRHEYSTD